MAAKPLLIKPNEKEFADLAGKDLETLADFADAATEVPICYQTTIAVSLSAEGAIPANRQEVLHVRSPRLTIKSAVGSGDCMLAGITYGPTHSFSFADSIKYGVAAGTANALMVGPGVFSQGDFERVLSDLTVWRINHGKSN